MSIYINQSFITIQLDTGISLAGASNAKIHYTKPDGVTGYWNATTSGNFIEYLVQNGNLDQIGYWIWQGEATMSDGRKAVARSVRQRVQAEFT